jgi:hypothetical protein
VDEAPLLQLPLLLSPVLEAPLLLSPVLEAPLWPLSKYSSRCSECNNIAVSDVATSTTSSAPNVGSTINATSCGHSQPTATSSDHSHPSINTGRNLDIHDAASLPVPAILDDNISVYNTAAVKMIHPCSPSPQRKQPPTTKENPILFNDQLEGLQRRTVNHLLDHLLLLPHWLT